MSAKIRVSQFALKALSLLLLVPYAYSLGTSCSAPLGSGNAAPGDPYWLETLAQRGSSAFNPNPASYVVRRNVKDFGAKGDGVTDDTAAINAAIAAGSRCGNTTCQSSTVSPALVYFPKGEYVVSTPIVSWYYTQLIGDPTDPPTIIATPDFNGIAVIGMRERPLCMFSFLSVAVDADPYIPDGGGINERSVRNFVIDLTKTPPLPKLRDFIGKYPRVLVCTIFGMVEMSTDPNTNHQGLFMENGSGGFLASITFNGGKMGMNTGNQQFTIRNVTINNAQIGMFMNWNWAWTLQGLNINNCQIGLQINTGGTTPDRQTAGSETIIDATVTNTPIFIQTTETSSGSLAGSLLLDNIALSNVPKAVTTAQGVTVLTGPGTGTITQWAQGNIFSGTSGSAQFIVGRSRPQYETYSASQIVSVKAQGAKGDGQTDDTKAIQAVFDQFSGCKIIFFDAGTYILTDTVTIPEGTIVTGEVWPVLMGTGSNFQSQTSPRPVVQVGASGSSGSVEISDIIFSTRGPTPGAIVVEWNVKGTSPASAAAWDTHIRLGSAAGTNLGSAECPAQGSANPDNCFAAFLGLHLTADSSAYIEAMWVWLGDHDLDGNNGQVNVFSGRGILSQSKGPVWFIGTASDHYLGMIQTESVRDPPRYNITLGPSPAPPAPFEINSAFNDPSFPNGLTEAWALYIQQSSDILVYGAGLYSFFQDYTQDCLNDGVNNCQSQIVNVDSLSSASVYGLSTLGVSFQLSVSGVGVINQGEPNNFSAEKK
ncbi:hypothetical protein Clacol_002208 [Clathrus columnatus]|uniref:Rhamnogalacturonase A/B/Epimerase-like pectate lyase domain-containing protein n=1 Tax=Clathrus columnatus TaxID=1419009 RepID=A0AAV5A602_9AGAM|nr:hypothetical protein Clacol_002208 [Clathrus columnatus]